MMTSTQVVETSVNITLNSSSQDYTHPDAWSYSIYLPKQLKPQTPSFISVAANKLLGCGKVVFVNHLAKMQKWFYSSLM